MAGATKDFPGTTVTSFQLNLGGLLKPIEAVCVLQNAALSSLKGNSGFQQKPEVHFKFLPVGRLRKAPNTTRFQ